MKKVLLIILDGWGISKNPNISAIDKANTPFIDYCYKQYPYSILSSSGKDVGLPDNQVGNSEVGHLNLGAGRIINQDITKINLSIKNGNLKNNELIQDAFKYSKINNKNIHIMGLLSDGGVHSHINHLFELLKIAAEYKMQNIFIHVFTDGRDTDPKSGKLYLKLLLDHIKITTGKLATIIGRYYSMDRNNNWIRIKQAYDNIIHGIGIKIKYLNIINTIQKYYNNGITDEFIPAITLIDSNNKAIGNINNGDVVVFFNFRNDRARQLTEALTQKNFPKYNMHKIKLYFITMTSYKDDYKNIKILFKKNNILNTLGEVLSKNNKKQLRIAETEKYPHVTFFFSGGREKIFQGESRIICPSPNVKTYDLQPEMSAKNIYYKMISILNNQEFDFICLNFANPDMVGHTGNMEATIKACETVDKYSKYISDIALKNDYIILLLSDHGNADCMINPNGTPNTSHTLQPVPCFLISKNKKLCLKKNGILSNIAPTILDIMNINKPIIMNTKSLIKKI